MFKAAHVITDTPVWIAVPDGPALEFTVHYAESSESTWLDMKTRLSDKWVCHWTAYAKGVGGGTVEVILPDGRRETYKQSGGSYDPSLLNLARLASSSGGHTRTTRDGSVLEFGEQDGSIHRLTKVMAERDAKGQVTEYEWCACGDLEWIIDARGHKTSWHHDMQGRVIAKEYPDGEQIKYTYWANSGQLKSVSFPEDGASTAYQYFYFIDGSLQKVDYTHGAMADQVYSYDAHYHRVSSVTNGTTTTSYTYNAVGDDGALEVKTITKPNSVALEFEYDELGRLTKRFIGTGPNDYQEEYDYDNHGRLQNETNILATAPFTYSYVGDTLRVDTIDSPNGQRATFTYLNKTGDRRLSQINHFKASTSTTISQFDYTYTPSGQIETWKRKLGPSSSNEKTWRMRYAAAYQLQEVEEFSSSGSLGQRFRYRYDKSGNRVSKVVDGGTAATYSHANYTADPRNQVTVGKETGPTPIVGTVDEAATVKIGLGAGLKKRALVTQRKNPVSTNTEYYFEGELNLSSGNNTLSIEATDASGNTKTENFVRSVSSNDLVRLFYDKSGNLEKKIVNPGATESVHTYGWDAINRLLWVQNAETIVDGTKRTRFEYNQLKKKRVTGNNCYGSN